ncbi:MULTISPECIES: SH3 domain-containing protein [unclassified Devosia]|uniref:SH3 domain-containing protein n=1 Tax=unclassified Devosia TaxID=196773 RepID=UPI001AC2CA82|nr:MULTISPECIES: SH3 domain-containing protein [unclassified Devosia]MBN9306671.1 SH3 domain-containing protein [Devosia sp.]
MRLLTIAVAMSAGALAPAAAQTFRTNEVGGPGGAAFSDSCGAGDVLIGINFRAGKALNTIGPVCSPAQGGNIVGTPYGLHTWGTSPKATDAFSPFALADAAWCPTGMAVQSLKVGVDGHDDVRGFSISCRNMATGEIKLDANNSYAGGVTARIGVAPCGSGTIATGVIGGHGALIDRLGLICSRFQDQNGKLLPVVGAGGVLPKDKPVRAVGKAVGTGGVLPKDKPVRAVGKAVGTTAPGRTPGEVDNGGGDNGGGKGGGNGQAVVGAAIYDAPDGTRIGELYAGTPVTITECGKQFDGWCEISRPKSGWVWGEDLGR